MKQTAVEWLVEQLQSNSDIRWRGTNINELGQQAKQMEKEQIINAWDNGWHEHMNPPSTYITSVDYYNETFKSE